MTTIADLAEEIKGLRADLFRANPPIAMNPVEAAQFLGVTVETMFLWRKNGTGPRFSQPTPRFLASAAACSRVISTAPLVGGVIIRGAALVMQARVRVEKHS